MKGIRSVIQLVGRRAMIATTTTTITYNNQPINKVDDDDDDDEDEDEDEDKVE